MTIPGSPYVGDPEAAVAFLADLNGSTVPTFELADADLIARLADGTMLYRQFAGDVDADVDMAVTAPGPDGLETHGLLSWCEDAVAARLGPFEPETPAAGAAVALAVAISDALVQVEGWVWAHAAAAAAMIAQDPPCGCAASIDPEHGDLHTQRQHRIGSCSGAVRCGGCYDCLAMQVAYPRSLSDPAAPAAPKPNVAVVIDPSPEAGS